MNARLRAAALLTWLCAVPALAASDFSGGAFADDTQAAAFLAADGDGDKQLDEAEFRSMIDALADAGRKNAVTVRRMNAYAMAFAKIDADGDGVLTIPELGAGKQLAREMAGRQ